MSFYVHMLIASQPAPMFQDLEQLSAGHCTRAPRKRDSHVSRQRGSARQAARSQPAIDQVIGYTNTFWPG